MSHFNIRFISTSVAATILVLLNASCGHFYTDILNQKRIIIPHSSDSELGTPPIEVRWARTVTGGSNYSKFVSVSVGSDGSVYAAGDISGIGTINFGNGLTATSTDYGSDFLLLKYNSSGNAQWVRTVTGGTQFSLNGVSATLDGFLYAAGEIYGIDTYDFGNGVTAAGTNYGTNIVLVKYNSSGTAQWAKTVTGGSTNSYLSSVSAASDGSIYVAGEINATGTINFGNGATTAGTFIGDNILLVKYNSSGTAQWAKTVIGGSHSSLFGVSAASDGSVYAAGYIDGAGTFNFANGVSATGTSSSSNMVLVKYNSFGNAQWARTVSGGSSSDLFGVSAVSDGSVYAAGIISAGTYDFGNGVTGAGSGGIIIVKYNSSGTAQWARTLTGGSNDSCFRNVSAASDGSVYAAGYIYGTGTFDFGNGVTAAGTYSRNNIILVKYNSSGTAQWARTTRSASNHSSFSGVSAATDGSVYATGYIWGNGTYDFGNCLTAASADTFNILLVKYK